MSYIQSIILGAIQGLLNFFLFQVPGIFSFKKYFNLGSVPVLFDILLHVATLMVVAAAFRKTIFSLTASLFRFLTRKNTEHDRENLNMILVILTATVFTGIIGYAISKSDLQSTKTVSSFFIVTGIVLLVPVFLEKKNAIPGTGKLKLFHGAAIGIAQGIAALPGVSRSGTTISAALVCGMDRKKAGEFSFILSIPAILGALALDIKDAGTLAESVPLPVLAAGLITAALAGALSLALLLRIIKAADCICSVFTSYLPEFWEFFSCRSSVGFEQCLTDI